MSRWCNDIQALNSPTPQKERPHFPITSAPLNQVFGRKKSNASFKKTTRKKKQSKNHFSNIDDKIEHFLQKAEGTFNISNSLEEFSNQWNLNTAELEQEQAFIKYLEELDLKMN